MGTVPIINPNDISSITGLGHKPIYFITIQGQAQATLVVKGENMLSINNNDALISMVWAGKLMKNVNSPQVNVKLMTPAEITEFLRAGNATFAHNSDEAYHLSVNYNWVKMPLVTNLIDLNIEVPDGTFRREDTKLIRAAIIKLLDNNIWYELGKVVAVDIFNGNNDRFNVQGNWVNKGNIMFVNNAIIGMDAWDPTGTNGGNMESNLVQGGGFDGLRTLIDTHRRTTFATTAVNSVGTELSSSLGRTGAASISFLDPSNTVIKVTLASLQTLFVQFQADFTRGLTDGATQLKVYLVNKRTTYRRNNLAIGVGRIANPVAAPVGRIPKGILDRMTYLGW